MSNRIFQWEISFNPDLLKPPEQVIFGKERPSRLAILKHFPIVLRSPKHWDLMIGSKLTLDIHIKSALAKVDKAIDPMRSEIFNMLYLDKPSQDLI